ATIAAAQAPINSNAAMQPNKGGLILRQRFTFTEADKTPMANVSAEMIMSMTTLMYGVSEKFTLMVNAPIRISSKTDNSITGAETDLSGLDDMKIMGKFRIFRENTGPFDTQRFDLLAGVEFPTGRDQFTSDSTDPIIGAVYTYKTGKHAFHTDLLWQFNNGDGNDGEDKLTYDLAYVYRLSPDVYSNEDPTALFGSIELNGAYETNNDQEIFLSPGLQYVKAYWALEATIQIPIHQRLDNRMERDYVFGIGFKFRF
ncbi:MAG: hypothetical protein H8E91_06815, partial [Planctomycetes bacterium]|nr:hypothetical protein [Planctomycetota bacterium]